MTSTLDATWDMPHGFPKWVLLVIIPMLLAAGAMEQTPSMTFPDGQSYKTPLSDALFESSEWRTPAQPESFGWREPSSSSLGWRTEPTQPARSSRSHKRINLFPRNQGGGSPFDFDHINREEKPQIKIFEFGS